MHCYSVFQWNLRILIKIFPNNFTDYIIIFNNIYQYVMICDFTGTVKDDVENQKDSKSSLIGVKAHILRHIILV